MDYDDEQEIRWKGVPGCIVLINLFDSFKQNTANIAHTAICRTVKQYLRLSTPLNLSVCIYGIEEQNNMSTSKDFMEIFPLAPATLSDYKKLLNLNLSKFHQTKELILSDVLWHCSKSFVNCKKLLSSRTIIILSRLDIAPSLNDQKPTLKRVVDLVDSSIELRVINLSEEIYEIDPFYKKLLVEANKGHDVPIPEPVWEPKLISNILYQHSHRHLALAKLSFEIGKDLSIGVGVYCLLARAGHTQNKKVDLEQETNAVLTSVTKNIKISTNRENLNDGENEDQKEIPLLRSEVIYYQDYGNEKVSFSSNDIKLIQNPFGPPMLKLLGFKPSSILCKEKWYLKMGYFLFPNDDVVEGSTIAFKALHQACIELSVVAVCVLCTHINARPNFVALSPTSRPLGLDIDLGFDVVCIPFAENVRNIPFEDDIEKAEISPSLKTVMNDVINTLQFEYKPDMFENPKLQSEYRALEAIALDEEFVEPFYDTTKPSSENFNKLQDDLFEEFFGPFGVGAVKRTAPFKTVTDSKKIKIDDNTLQNRIKNKSVHEFTVPELKQILKDDKNSKIPALTGLKKSELVKLVYDNYTSD